MGFPRRRSNLDNQEDAEVRCCPPVPRWRQPSPGHREGAPLRHLRGRRHGPGRVAPSDATMDEILKFVEGLCHALGAIDPTLETLCVSLIEAQLPEIINGLVQDNLDPSQVCSSIGACAAPPTTTTAAPNKRFARLL